MQISRLSRLVNCDPSIAEPIALVPRHLFIYLLEVALRSKGQFDENYYLKSNPDVQGAVMRGEIANGSDHYFMAGYFEGRLPAKIAIDEKYYLKQNPDIADALRRGSVQSAQQHFDVVGFKEARLPYPNFSLF
jgi:hypothetical protein